MVNPRERMARALCCPSGCCVGLAVLLPGQCEMDDTDLARADAALAVARELVRRPILEAVLVPPDGGAPTEAENEMAERCCAAALRALGETE